MHVRGQGGMGGGVSKNHVKVKGGVSKNQAWHILHCTSSPLPINNDQSLRTSKISEPRTFGFLWMKTIRNKIVCNSLRWPIYNFNLVDTLPNYLFTPHRRSTTVSLETYPLYLCIQNSQLSWRFCGETANTCGKAAGRLKAFAALSLVYRVRSLSVNREFEQNHDSDGNENVQKQ